MGKRKSDTLKWMANVINGVMGQRYYVTQQIHLCEQRQYSKKPGEEQEKNVPLAKFP